MNFSRQWIIWSWPSELWHFVVLWSSSLSSYHGVGPLFDLFWSHISRSLFSGLPWFLLPFGLLFFFLLSSVFCYEAFCLYVASTFFCNPVFWPKLGLYIIPLQSLYFFVCGYQCFQQTCHIRPSSRSYWHWVVGGLYGKVEWLSRTRKLASQTQSREGPFHGHCWEKLTQVI